MRPGAHLYSYPYLLTSCPSDRAAGVDSKHKAVTVIPKSLIHTSASSVGVIVPFADCSSTCSVIGRMVFFSFPLNLSS